jgi:hypothetical protein
MKYFLLLLASINNFNGISKHKKFIKIASKELFYVAIFPAQKYIAVSLTSLEFTPRKEKFISDEQLKNINNELEPGDILLKRNEWQATNIGIPGFWTHTGLYIGDLEEMDIYFKDVKILNNIKFSEFLKTHNIKIYNVLFGNNTLNIIESIEEGVSIKNLSNIAKTDYFSALRPNLSKEDKFNAILKAIEFIGKPYDYHFNPKSKEALICSEVIKESYKNKIKMLYNKKLGKKIFYPNNIAHKYAIEYKNSKRELDFVLFYDLDIESKKAIKSNEIEFLKSYKRNISFYYKKNIIKYLYTTIGSPFPIKKK